MSDFVAARRNMVDCQVRPSDVTDRAVLEALLVVPREAFLAESQKPMAYLDLDLQIGRDGERPRVLMKPVVAARLLQAAEIVPSDKVLVVGDPCGYLAAVIAALGNRVVAVDNDAALADAARRHLAQAGYAQVEMSQASATAGCPDQGPYDVIVLGGATEIEPSGLYEQLTQDGRLVGVFASSRPSRAMIVTRSQDEFGSRPLFDATLAVLPGLERPKTFVF